MFKETANRIDYWTEEVERLKKELAETDNLSDDEIMDLQMSLHEAKENLNFSWQDDELEEMGLR